MINFLNVSKHYNGFKAVKNLSLHIRKGETLVLIGTSGCGKTTTLKMINRLIEPTEGTIEIDGRNISHFDVIHLRRTIGYVIQSIGLFPHMTVGENISIVPQLLKWSKKKIAFRIDKLLEMVGLKTEQYRHRYPVELSGGQQQRIGVARALAADPSIILMDEPFGALDPITRERLQNEFLDLAKKIKKTIIFVTHDIFEAIKIADRLALMDKGGIIQIGTPQEIIEHPTDEFVINFLGKHHFLLSLLLIPIEDITASFGMESSTNPSFKRYPSVNDNATIFDILNYFKQHETEKIIIQSDDGVIKGCVTKKMILARIMAAL